jgi:hypothetical protein
VLLAVLWDQRFRFATPTLPSTGVAALERLLLEGGGVLFPWGCDGSRMVSMSLSDVERCTVDDDDERDWERGGGWTAAEGLYVFMMVFFAVPVLVPGVRVSERPAKCGSCARCCRHA